LDGFKAVNDALGHATGDELLKRVAARLLACIRASDTACRHGGDEFVILLTEVADDEGELRAAEKIRAHLAMPYVIGESAIQMTTSIGVAVYPIDGSEYGDLLRRSDFAMFRNKGNMSSRPSIFRLDQAIASSTTGSRLGECGAVGEESGSPPVKCCGEPKYDDCAGNLSGGSPSTLIGTTPSALAGSPCGFLQTP
jgi:diguanylate cyclase (GGDEF)-like protein